MQNTSLSTLLNKNYIDKKYGSLILGILAYNGIITMSDLLNISNPNVFRGVGKKKANAILELRDCVRQLHNCDFDIISANMESASNDAINNKDIQNSSLVEQLATIPVEDIGKYIKCGTIPNSVKTVGVITLKDLWYKNFDCVTTPGFSKKKAKDLQNEFHRFSQAQLEDIIFWNANRVLPSAYDSDKTIEENLQLVLDELIDYVNGCFARVLQIRTNNEKKRVANLKVALNSIYKKNMSREDTAVELGFINAERVRQLLYLELLYPLFKGEKLKYEILCNISINADLVERIKDFRGNMLFKSYFVKEDCSITFFEDVIGVDVLQHSPLSYIVPSGKKLIYRSVLKAFFDEMSAVMKSTPVQDLAEIIDANAIIQREVYDKGQTYSEEFVYQRLYDKDLTHIDDVGVLLKYEYIRCGGLYDLGNVIQERALARIIADSNEPITNDEVIATYYNRYNIKLDNPNLTTTKKFGCQSYGKTHWVYSSESITNLRDWIETFSIEINRPFTWDDIMGALANNDNIAYKSDATVRTYITQFCAVNNRKDDYFCHRDIVDQQQNPSAWRKRAQAGILNWIANEIHLMFNNANGDFLLYADVYEYLVERAKACNEGITKTVIQNNIYTILCRRDADAPFEVEYKGRNIYKIKKRIGIYENTDWLDYGTKGRGCQRKLISCATYHIRKTKYYQLPLTDLVEKIYKDIEGDVYDNSQSPLTQKQIRKKLQDFIRRNDLNHSLRLLKVNNTLHVQLDARQENEDRKYNQENSKKSSEVTECNWEHLVSLFKSELSFCQEWLREEQIDTSYDTIVDRFADFIKNHRNPNLREIVPQRLYEFFIVSNPTANDRYCIMCNIAKNFEALIDTVYNKLKYDIPIDQRNLVNGIYKKAEVCGFDDYTRVLDSKKNINDFENGSWQHSLKKLTKVRNTDAHANWYTDYNSADNLSESERNIQNILRFAALYIFTYAKYVMNYK